MKIVLITGGSRGIGAECVRLFSEAGCRVAFTYNNSKSQADELSLKTGALAIKADSRIESEVKNAIAVVNKNYGDVDILVNNAAISSFRLFTDLTLEEWNDTISVSLGGAFLYSRECLPAMIRKKQGRIINLSSMWGIVGSSCEVHYSAAKAGLIGMTKALAKEVGPSGITVNAVAPGVINTDMNQSISDEDKKVLIEETPMCRIGEPIEVAKAVFYLASDDASFITGEVLNINGGFVI